jgi:pimeloyl-ACP methyl ester carboxylesterase
MIRSLPLFVGTIGVGALLVASPAPASAQPVRPLHEYFYVGGTYSGTAGNRVMTGQMYVEVLRPPRVQQPYPLVFFHGAWQTGTNWIATPDGRPGWADYFLGRGYLVYLVDQPARGRSAWQASVNGPLGGVPPTATVEQRFTAPEVGGNWPQAKRHTQWPGDGDRKGRAGDPVFDAFYATQVPSLASAVETQTLVKAAGAALLDKIGPAILVTHSQAGPFGWLIADARPSLVRGIVAVEPGGPPFQNAVADENPARPWGLADIPLTYAPPASQPGDLKTVQQSTADGPGLSRCWKQADPPRQLARLHDIPILVATGEASYHAVYDHCTAQFLTQAGATNTFLRLESQGIRGNGHMMMLEKNSMEIAAAIHSWIAAHVK